MTIEHLMAFRPHEIVLHSLPIDLILRNSLFYPNCGLDGEIIRSCNQQFTELGICSFIYCDSRINQEQLIDNLDTFSHYKVLATKDFNPFHFPSIEEPAGFDPPYEPYGRWTVYEKDPHNYIEGGPERFSLLFFGGQHMFMENIYALYRDNHIPLKAFVGGVELNNHNSPSAQIIFSYPSPEFVFFKGANQDEEFMDDAYSYEGEADIHPNGNGNVTIWRLNNLIEQ